MDRMKSITEIIAAIIVALVAAAPVSCSRDNREASSDYRYKAAAIVVAKPSEPTPSPQPVDGVCDNCKGTGKLGDGTVVRNCPVCGGDGRTDNELPLKSVLSAIEIDAEQFSMMKPSRRWQAVVVGMIGCKPCKLLKDDITKTLGSGWMIEEFVSIEGSFASYSTQGEADIIFDDNWEKYRDYGMNEGDVLPCTLLFADGKVIERINGRVSATEWAMRITAAVKRLPAQSQDYGAIPGGSVHAANEIEAALGIADKFLGRGGAITITRPAGEVDAGQATIYFPSQTTIRIQSFGDKITATCEPAPRLQIRGVPILKPSLSGVTITRDAITLDLFRWPDVAIAVKESR